MHGIGSYANNNGIENEGLFMLVYNRVGVGLIINSLKYINKKYPINNTICIVNLIVHGIYCV